MCKKDQQNSSQIHISPIIMACMGLTHNIMHIKSSPSIICGNNKHSYINFLHCNSSRDDKLSERVKKSQKKNRTQLGIEPRTF